MLVAEDLAPSDTAGLDPGWSSRWSPSAAAPPATPRSSPGSSASRAWSARRRHGDPGRHPSSSTARPARSSSSRDPRTPRAVAEPRAARRARAPGPARRDRRRHADQAARQRRRRRVRGARRGPSRSRAVGLFRTELCFLNRTDEPTVEEQADIYARGARAFGADGRYVVVRTLDAGSDKPIAFATHEGEENPALGVRGLRLSFDNPGLLDRQLDGIALAAERTGTETWVMAPMVATVAEATDFAEKVRARGLKPGVMVEIPSAALLAHRMLEVVDFLSIGTNDLTQYAMAADRMATDLAHLTDPWQPAVLQLIAITAEAGKQAGKPVGVCGEAAADPLLATALVGMGITSLSMAAATTCWCIDSVGLCFSDVKIMRQGGSHPKLYNRDLAKEPTRLGHEVSLTVIEVGDNLKDQYHAGQRLAVQPDIYQDGKSTAYGYTIPGGLIQYHLMGAEMSTPTTVPACCPLPDTMGYAEASTLEPWGCVMAAYTQRRRLGAQDRRDHVDRRPARDERDYLFSSGLDLRPPS